MTLVGSCPGPEPETVSTGGERNPDDEAPSLTGPGAHPSRPPEAWSAGLWGCFA